MRSAPDALEGAQENQDVDLCPDTAHAYVGLARTINICGVYTVLLAGKSPNKRSYTVYIYGSGHPCAYGSSLTHHKCWLLCVPA